MYKINFSFNPEKRLGSREYFIGILLVIIGGCNDGYDILQNRGFPPWPPPEGVTLSAGKVQAALEGFKAQNNRYPDSLSQLTSSFIDSIPNPDWGSNKWNYSSGRDGLEYELSVTRSENDYAGYYYFSSTGKWTADG
jgi:hypothetical protein